MNPYSKSERVEMALYRAVGIRLFRDGAFALERWVHRKDGGKNTNYHVRDLTYHGVARHYALLSFNAALHFTAFAFLFLLILGALFFVEMPGLWYGIIGFLALLNLYCILLQRYNALRLRALRRRLEEKYRERLEKRAAMLLKRMPEAWENRLPADLLWLSSLRECILSGRDVHLGEEDAAVLTRLYRWAEDAGVRWEQTAGHEPLFPREKKNGALYSRADWIARRLQQRFHRKQELLVQPCAVITAGQACEQAYVRLFRRDSADAVLEVLDTFLCLREQAI